MTLRFTFLIFSIAALCTSSLAQDLTQSLISSSGSTYQISGSSLSFSIGELAVSSHQFGEGALTEGLHQPSILITDVADFDRNINLRIYPNPTVDQVILESELLEKALVEILSIDGNLVMTREAQNGKTEIDFSSLTSGIYMLRYHTKSALIATARITKI